MLSSDEGLGNDGGMLTKGNKTIGQLQQWYQSEIMDSEESRHCDGLTREDCNP